MKILLLNDFGFINGGTSQVAISEALGLADLGYDVTFFYAVGPLDERLSEHKEIKTLTSGDFDILHDPNRIRAGIKGIWNIDAGRLLDQWLSENSHEDVIVHLHGWSKALSSIVGRVITQHILPFVCTLHDYFIACPNGGFYKYPKQELCHLRPLSWACLVENCDVRSYSHKLWRFARTWSQKHLGMLPNRLMNFIVVSEFSRDILKPYLPESCPIYLLPNPINVAKRSPVPVAENSKFTYVGRLSPEKGPLLLSRVNRDHTFELTFVGDGELRKHIEELDETATVTGWLDQSGVMTHLDNARALVFPSKWYETSGMVVLEEAARGVPAVVSDICAAREYVADGMTGLWFRQRDEQNLRDKLNALGDDGLVARLGSAAYQRYWERPFTREVHLSSLVDIYEDIIRAASRRII